MLSTPGPRCHIDFATNPYDATRQWTDVTEWLRAFDVGVGRQHELLTFEPQEGEIVFDNRDGRFDPSNTGSPYYPNVLPIRPVRLVSGYKWEVLATNPIAYWRLGEADGATTAVDEMGSFNLTKTGSPVFGRTGRIPGNGAVEFFNNTADVLSSTAFTPALESAFTFAIWIKKDDLGVQRLIMTKGGTARDIDIRITPANKAHVGIVDATPTPHDLTGATSITAGTWYFVVATWDGTFLRIYLNGALDGTSGDFSATPPRDSGNVVRLGRNISADNQWDGLIDEPAVWDRALTQEEITKLFEEGDRWPTAITVKDTGPAAHWKLDETASGIPLADEVGGFTLTKSGGVVVGVEGRLPGIPGNKGVEFFAAAVDRLQNTAFTLPLNGNVSMAAWVFIDSFSDRYIISKGVAGTQRDFYLTIDTPGRGRIGFFDTGAVARELFTPNNALTTGRWYFLVGTWDGTFLRIYVDGVLSNTSASLAGITPRDSGDDLRIGAPQTPVTTNVWDGKIDDPAIWTRALTAQEIADLYNADIHHRQADGHIWTGFIHEWRPVWDSSSDADVVCKVFDSTALLPLDDLIHPYVGEVKRHSLNGYWRFREGSASEEAKDEAGKHHGRYNAFAVFAEGPVTGGKALEGSVELGTGPAIVGTQAFSVAAWFYLEPKILDADGGIVAGYNGTGTLVEQRPATGGYWRINFSSNNVFFETNNAGSSQQQFSSVGTSTWYFLVGVREADGRITLYVYANGALQASPSSVLTMRNIGAAAVVAPVSMGSGCFLAELAIFPAALTSAQVAAMYAARTAWSDQKSGDRVNNVLDVIGFPSAERNIEAGQSVLQAASDLDSSALQHLQDVAQTENGIFFPASDGKLTFFDRHHIFLDSRSVDSQATFGDNPVLSEFPYHLQEGMDPVIDEIDIRNEIHTQSVGGALFIAKDQASIDKYRRRVYDERTSMLAALDNETKAAGEGLLNQYKTPKERVRTFLFTPHSWPEYLFPIMLGAQMWDRIIWKRTPVGSASRTVVEGLLEGKRISWDGESGEWACSLQVNPFAPAPSSRFIWDTSKWNTDAAWVY